MKLLKFSRGTHFLGRNGFFKSAGLEIDTFQSRDIVEIVPLTSRMAAARCCIEIPIEDDVDAVITALQQLKKEYKCLA